MGDPAATLRALAGACVECDRISKSDDHEWAANQRHVIVNALPDVTGWPATAAELRTMADTVERLTRERDEARALLADAARPPVATATLTAIRAWLEATNA